MVNAMDNQGLALVDAGKFDEAVVEFRRAVSGIPELERAPQRAALLDHHDGWRGSRSGRRSRSIRLMQAPTICWEEPSPSRERWTNRLRSSRQG